MNRRQFISTIAGSVTLGLAGCLGADWEPTDESFTSIRRGRQIGLRNVASNLTHPIQIAFPESQPFSYIADKVGQIFVNGRGDSNLQPFLDLRNRLLHPLQSWEQGLLGFTLHPNFTRNRKFYVRYSAPLRGDSPPEYSHRFILSEFVARDDLKSANPGSERLILEIPQPGKWHQSGAITFGPDGYLYVGVGDGGSPTDSAFGGYGDTGPGHGKDWYLINRGGNGQDVENNLLGSILRIDIDSRDSGRPYGIPDDNPLVDEEGFDEQFAWGFRNPYRFTFDRSRLIAGDVGSANFEEIDIVQKGGNYGWNVMEGRSCFNANSALNNGLSDDVPAMARGIFQSPPLRPIEFASRRFLALDTLPYCPQRTPEGSKLIEPAVVYPHYHNGRQVGSAVIGGYVYRGADIGHLDGKYVFGDFSSGQSGRIFTTDLSQRQPAINELSISGSSNSKLNEFLLSFGRDNSGELYVLTTKFAEGSGNVYQITTGRTMA